MQPLFCAAGEVGPPALLVAPHAYRRTCMPPTRACKCESYLRVHLLSFRLPRVIITIALYGNPEMPEGCPGRCTIGQYTHLKNTCDDLVDAYLYQDYANQKDDEDTNRDYIEKVGNVFGWPKFGFGVGVGGIQNNPDGWRWYPDQPGTTGKNILSTLLTGPYGQYMRGVRRRVLHGQFRSGFADAEIQIHQLPSP